MLRRIVLAPVLALLTASSVAFAQSPLQDNTYRVGGMVKAPTKVLNVAPVYPEIARAQGQEGVVILELLLDTEGAVESATVIRAVPLLSEAAVDAARQWKYSQTLVNGVPARIRYNVTVSFKLADSTGAAVTPQTADANQAAPAPPAPDTPAPATTTTPDTQTLADANEPAPVRVGGAVRAPVKILDVPPVYPAVAQQARAEGVVILEVLVAPSGAVRDARVIRSVPLLDEAALEAVRQWVYTPTFLNDVAVPIYYNVTVAFSLKK